MAELQHVPFLPTATLAGTESVPTVKDGVTLQTTPSAIAALAAANSADVLVKTANSGLSAERVVTDTASVTWNWGTAGQAKANATSQIIAGCTVAYGGAVTNAKNITGVADGGAGVWDITITANTATKYVAMATLMGGDNTSANTVTVLPSSATSFQVTTQEGGALADLAFSFLLFSLDF